MIIDIEELLINNVVYDKYTDKYYDSNGNYLYHIIEKMNVIYKQDYKPANNLWISKFNVFNKINDIELIKTILEKHYDWKIENVLIKESLTYKQ